MDIKKLSQALGMVWDQLKDERFERKRAFALVMGFQCFVITWLAWLTIVSVFK